MNKKINTINRLVYSTWIAIAIFTPVLIDIFVKQDVIKSENYLYVVFMIEILVSIFFVSVYTGLQESIIKNSEEVVYKNRLKSLKRNSKIATFFYLLLCFPLFLLLSNLVDLKIIGSSLITFLLFLKFWFLYKYMQLSGGLFKFRKTH